MRQPPAHAHQQAPGYQIHGRYGDVEDIDEKRDPVTGRVKGFAFVTPADFLPSASLSRVSRHMHSSNIRRIQKEFSRQIYLYSSALGSNQTRRLSVGIKLRTTSPAKIEDAIPLRADTAM